DRVSAVAKFGVTERQARFLTTVMLHSGLCVPRQFATFAGIAYGHKVPVLRSARRPPVRHTMRLPAQPRGALSRAVSAAVPRDRATRQSLPSSGLGPACHRPFDAS